ncbi:transmembrane transport protein [Microbispora cellulosiformans]|uniref:Transmembrane transport protein n=1 Tax=Microbispora cellulosiformans TaxID=2614688 RepID=A0A5J5K351_9ACTN|nr:transmembrane transport protein [Microbispora cellulosiformans]KAA9377669.1 transmembrane transport protein [Microbispora cellulosiformans]
MSEQTPAARRDVPTELERALAAEISLGSRMRHVAVGLAGGCAAALIAVLWATEPYPLPARTQAAFAALIAIGLAWAAFAGWTLSRRRPLFARDRVLGAWLALVVTVVTGVAGTALAAARGTTAEALATALAGVALVAAAGLVLVRARARRRELLRLRDALREDTARIPGTHRPDSS